MPKLHVFNPEHDLALACGRWHYTPPQTVCRLRRDLAWLPAIWAKAGDWVLVEDADEAAEALKDFQARIPSPLPQVLWITPQILNENLSSGGEAVQGENDLMRSWLTSVVPWGWDKALIWQLLHTQFPGGEDGLSELETFCKKNLGEKVWGIRQLSSRQFWYTLLQHDVDYVETREQLKSSMLRHGGVAVLKALWSSSGKGVHVAEVTVPASYEGMSLPCMVEPFYHKVLDFGMEFEIGADGTVRYLGLSLFRNRSLSYSGNLLSGEGEKETLLQERGVDGAVLQRCRERVMEIVAPQLAHRYIGPFGIDFLSVDDEDLRQGIVKDRIQVCELNLRRTMGHVALALSRRVRGTMVLSYVNRHYRLEVRDTSDLTRKVPIS